MDPSGAYNLDNVFKKNIEGGVVDTIFPIVEESYQKILVFVKLAQGNFKHQNTSLKYLFLYNMCTFDKVLFTILCSKQDIG